MSVLRALWLRLRRLRRARAAATLLLVVRVHARVWNANVQLTEYPRIFDEVLTSLLKLSFKGKFPVVIFHMW